MMFFPFSEWSPDRGFIGPDVLARAFQVYATGAGYLPMKAMSPFSAPLPGICSGSASFVDRGGNIVTVAGDETGLYVSSGQGWRDISRTERYNAAGQIWRFAVWGDYVLATDYNDQIQAWEVGSPGNFFTMAESAPRCKDMAIVNEFLVLANTVDGYDGERPNRIWWSPIGDPFGTWEPDEATLCDYQDIQIGAFCVGVAGGSYGTVLMRQALIRMNFIGSPAAFSIETVEPDRGCVGTEAFVVDGMDIYYASQDGFYMWNGAQSVSLSAGKVDKWFFDNSEPKASDLIIATFDKEKKTVLFGYPGKGQFAVPDKMLVYSVIAGKWTESTCPVLHFTQFLSKGYSLDELDEVSESVDELPFSLDSNYYKGGVFTVGGFGTDGRLYLESEDDLDGILTSGWLALVSNEERACTSRIRPVLEGGEDHTMTLSAKQSAIEEGVFGRVCQLTPIGDFTERKSGRYHAFSFTFKGRWRDAKGFDVTLAKEGWK